MAWKMVEYQCPACHYRWRLLEDGEEMRRGETFPPLCPQGCEESADCGCCVQAVQGERV